MQVPGCREWRAQSRSARVRGGWRPLVTAGQANLFSRDPSACQLSFADGMTLQFAWWLEQQAIGNGAQTGRERCRRVRRALPGGGGWTMLVA